MRFDAWTSPSVEPITRPEEGTMNRMIRLLGSALLVPSSILVGTAQGAISTDVSTDAISCSTVIATASFRPTLSFGGTATSATIKIKGKLSGCVDITNPAVLIDSGTFQGTLTGTTSDCFALTGTQPAAGSLVYRWKANVETPIQQSSSIQTVRDITGAVFRPVLADPAFGEGAYLSFALGTGGVTGAFAGGDAGASSKGVLITSESNHFFNTACAPSAAGIRTLHLGIGTILLG